MPKKRHRDRSSTLMTSYGSGKSPKTLNSAVWKLAGLIGLLLVVSVTFATVSRWNAGRISSTAVAPMPLTTPQYNANVPAKEYVYAGSKLVAVVEPENPPPADLAVWRPTNGNWYVLGGTGSAQVTQGWGQSGDVAAPGDFDGDGKTDFCVFRPDDPSTGYGKWYIMRSADSSIFVVQWGLTNDLPVVADYDGDGKSDLALRRNDDPSSGNTKWYINRSSDSSQPSTSFGLNTDKPAPADYDGDGSADLAVWRGSDETFRSITSSNSSSNTIAFDPSNAYTFGSADPVSGDFDGDNKADYAVWDSTSYTYARWYYRSSISTSIVYPAEWGISGDKTVQNDYDGDGKCDVAVWRPSNGTWYILNSSDSSGRIQAWGLNGDTPVPAYYRR